MLQLPIDHFILHPLYQFASFSRHAIKNKSRIWEIGVKYARTIAKIQIGAIFHLRDIRRNVGVHLRGRMPKETSVLEFCYENRNSSVVGTHKH